MDIRFASIFKGRLLLVLGSVTPRFSGTFFFHSMGKMSSIDGSSDNNGSGKTSPAGQDMSKMQESTVLSTHLWNTPLNLYEQAIKGFLS